MRYRVSELKLNIDEYNRCKDDPELRIRILESLIRKKFKKQKLEIKDPEIVRESVDARKKDDIRVVYTVDFDTKERLKADTAPNMSYSIPGLKRKSQKRPVVVGFGPAGMFCALILARAGLKPIVLERGSDVDTRTKQVEHFWETGELNVNSNVQFGEGGAGTFSDGKLTTGIKDERIRQVLRDMVSFGAPEDILYKAKPHIGTDILRNVVKALRTEVISLGGEVRFDTVVNGIIIENDCVSGVKTNEGTIDTDTAIFAIGHSSRDTVRMFNDIGIRMEQKPFSIGVRIEHPQDMIDISQYGKPSRELGLPVADYKINHRCSDGRGVYTFCMCPGGKVVVASSCEGMVVTNGMSYRNRDSGTANSALLVDVRTSDFGSDDVLSGVEFQEKYERLAFENGFRENGRAYLPPKSLWGDLRDGNAPHVENSLPEFAVSSMREAMPHLGRKIKGFDRDDAVVTAVETRSSSPVRIIRNQDCMGMMNDGDRIIKGFYPAGEGAGYAGGIMSAAVDGMKIAEKIIEY